MSKTEANQNLEKNYPHDWWYFWVWYDMKEHRPLGVVYDFHHNLRAERFTDMDRVQKDGLHVRTYHDAGGHRALWDTGEEVGSGEMICYGLGYSLWEIFEGGGGFCPTPRDALPGDQLFGAMIAWLRMKHSIAAWRDFNSNWNEGQTWKVEEFPHWVWVYGVETDVRRDSIGERLDRVLYTGDNIYSGSEANLWPYDYNIGISNRPSTYLPWRSNVSWAPGWTGMWAISSTEMVWKWRSYYFFVSYNPKTGKMEYWYPWEPLSPVITTRYWDGSQE